MSATGARRCSSETLIGGRHDSVLSHGKWSADISDGATGSQQSPRVFPKKQFGAWDVNAHTDRWPNAYFTECGYRSLRTIHTGYVKSTRELTDWRAACGKSARTVPRDGSPVQPDIPTPY